MSVVHGVVRRLTDGFGFGGGSGPDGGSDPGRGSGDDVRDFDGGRNGLGPDRLRRRSTLAVAAAAASALLCGLAACGVQPTGVHVTTGGPITLDPSSPASASSGPSAGQYTFFLFLWKGKSTSIVTPVMRTADHELSPLELLDALGYVNEDEVSDGYATYVPPSLTEHLTPTRQLHQYQTTEALNSSAVTQMVCTLDLYWSIHPDPNPQINASTEITGPGIYPSWDDCSTQPGFVEAQAKAEEGLVAQSGFEGAAPAPTAEPAKQEPSAETKTP
jgi:hypothetical protein